MLQPEAAAEDAAGGARMFWEIYGGCCALTRAVQRRGMTTHFALDLSRESWQDVLQLPVQWWILGRIRRGQVRFVHLAPPCLSFSRARRCSTRTAAVPEGDGTDPVETEGNAHAAFARQVCITCLAASVDFSLEHPRLSFLWWLRSFKALALLPNVRYVDLDQCTFGARPPDAALFSGDVRTMKPTRILTTAAAMEVLAERCRRDHEHVQLKGNVPAQFGGGKRTSKAAAYPEGLCRRWAEAVDDACCPSRVLRRWMRLIQLHRAGDIERHPGPSARMVERRGQRAGLDLLVVDIVPSTLRICEERLEEFVVFWATRGSARPWQSLRGPGAAIAHRLCEFLRQRFASQQWGRAQGAQLIAAVKRHLVWALAAGEEVVEPETFLAPVRRLLRSWQRLEPVECNEPVPKTVALAIFTVMAASGNWACALMVALGFHCLLRPEELKEVRWSDVNFAAAAVRDEYTVVQALVAIRRPKIRTGVRHANMQYVTVECPQLANLIRWLTVDLTDAERELRVFPLPAGEFLRYWRAGLTACGLTGSGDSCRLACRRSDAPLVGASTCASPSLPKPLGRGEDPGALLARRDLRHEVV